jgi:hypothetical protein
MDSRSTDIAGTRFEVPAVTCEMAAALALWLTNVVQPSAEATLGSRVVAVDHLGAYACRRIGGTSIQSQHARANALDISAFRLADGRQVRVRTDWVRDIPEARFLRTIHKGACRYFRAALGPGFDLAHKDHFHFDRGRWRACR